MSPKRERLMPSPVQAELSVLSDSKTTARLRMNQQIARIKQYIFIGETACVQKYRQLSLQQ